MKAEPTVGIAIPALPIRGALLGRAVRSVLKQTYPVAQISVAIDNDHEGAGPTRNRAKNALSTELTGLLDDDDELEPFHVQALVDHMRETGADLVFPWYTVIGGTDPLAELEHIEWNDATPHIFPITVLMRTELAQSLDFDPPMDPSCGAAGEDFKYWKALLASGAKFAHLYTRSWKWHHDSNNTAGLPSRWVS